MKNQTKTNKKTRKNSFLFCMLLSVSCLLPLSAFAQGGTTGPLTWNLTGNVLTISGNGAMPNYPYQQSPWWRDRESIHNIVIENGVTSIGNCAFYYCKNLTTITIPNGITRIGFCAFQGCENLLSITFPDGITSIEGSAFSYCYKLTSITLPSTLISIGPNAFRSCYGFTSITLPRGLEDIGSYAFNNCINLTSITNLNPVPIRLYTNDNTFLGVPKTCILRVPKGSVADYKHSTVWMNFHVVGDGDYYVQTCVNNYDYGYVVGGGLYEVTTIVTLTATAFEGYKFVNWTKDGKAISTENPYSFMVTTDVALGANFENNAGVENIEMGTVKIYPNPATGELKIENGELKIKNVEVFDIYGRNVLSHTTFSTPHTVLNISHLFAGVYFVKIFTEVGEVVRKVVKE